MGAVGGELWRRWGRQGLGEGGPWRGAALPRPSRTLARARSVTGCRAGRGSASTRFTLVSVSTLNAARGAAPPSAVPMSRPHLSAHKHTGTGSTPSCSSSRPQAWHRHCAGRGWWPPPPHPPSLDRRRPPQPSSLLLGLRAPASPPLAWRSTQHAASIRKAGCLMLQDPPMQCMPGPCQEFHVN